MSTSLSLGLSLTSAARTTGGGVLSRAILAYWSATKAQVSGGVVDSVPGAKGRTLLKMTDPTRPALTSGRMVFTNAAASRLIEGGALSPLKLTASQTVTLPDGTGTDAGKGITCTGGATAPDGTRWVMNFGLAVEGSPTSVAPSVVHLSADFTTKLLEIPFASMTGNGGVKPTVGAQGLAIDPTNPDGYDLVFYANDKIWFVSASGEIRRTLDFTAFAINGIVYDPTADGFIACPTGNPVALRWISKTTAELGRSVTIYGDGTDHLALFNGFLWYSGGANGSTQGGAIRQLDLNSERVVGQWFTGADAPEGLYVDADGVWLLDDGYHHGTFATNTVRHYVLDPAASAYPGAGRRALFAGIVKINSTVGSTTALFSVGEPITSGGQGFGLFVPSGSLTQLRVHANNSAATFTVPDMTTEFLFCLDMDYGTGAASLYRNGILIATTAVSGLASVSTFPPMQLVLGATREGASITRSSNSRFANLMMATDPALRELMEAEVAWDAGADDLLPADHPYKTARP